ncbi:unnamed protein product [Rhizoctonia solani]|uniref:Uncharacterized protein n=1 Tax=Rhizoctonia solani TaxID=456999 RepID=A0A8H3E5R3_9AGAM|nr:unnamed protein product [Rhizoctonia solani]
MAKSFNQTAANRLDFCSSKHFAYRQPVPNKRSLLQTAPLSPPSNISALLDWGNGPTEFENLGLSGLEEFRSSIRPSVGGLPVAQPALLKRTRSVGERPQGSSSTKKPRFAVPLLVVPHLPFAATKIQNAALSALQSKSSTRSTGSVRLRLGLSKRTNIGSKLEPNRPINTPYDVSVKVKPIPRYQAKDPPSFPVTDSSNGNNSADGTLGLGFKIPDSAPNATRTRKFQTRLPTKQTTPGYSRQADTSDIPPTGEPRSAGKVLVPASPSSLTDRIIETPVTPDSGNPSSPDNCADTSMLSDGVPESPLSPLRTAAFSSSFLPPPAFPALSASLFQADNRAQAWENDLSNSTSDILLSASLSLSLEEPKISESSPRENITGDLSSDLDTSYDLKPNQLMASVFYDSSQDSNGSQPDPPINNSTILANISTASNNYDSPPWDLSQQDDQDDGSHIDRPLRSPVASMTAKPLEVHISGPENAHFNYGNFISSDPRRYHANLGLIPVLYDSSQDSPRSKPRKGTLSDDRDQRAGKHPTDVESSIPRPTWSPDTSPRSYSNCLLSGAKPSSSWGSLPGLADLSADDLVPASRSLSLEDFEVRCPSAHQSHDKSPAHPRSLTRLHLSTAHHRNVPIGSINGGPSNVSSSRGSRTGMSKLASYASIGSLVGSHSPILSFTPLPKPSILNNSLESIESPDTTQRIDAGKSFRPNPVFKFPVPKPTSELEDDISCESQVLRPKLTSAPHGTQPPSQLARTPDEVPRFENTEPRGDSASGVPNSDGASANGPQAVDETENMGDQKITQSDHHHPAPDHPSSLTPQPRPPSPLISKIYKGYLHTVIPQPHFLPSLPCPPPSLTEGMLASLVPPSFQNWLNEDGQSAQDQEAAATNFLSDTWGRAAWIIPVRGRPPWDGCSGAVVSLRPIKERKKKIIVWTPASLRSFWTQMAGFRDTKRVGSLSMSFEAVPGKPEEPEEPKQPSELKASRSFEFIKLYHDSRVSLKLRTILQVLEFADDDRYGVDASVLEGEPGATTMRRLLGSSTRLALSDSTGHIVLIS